MSVGPTNSVKAMTDGGWPQSHYVNLTILQ